MRIFLSIVLKLLIPIGILLLAFNYLGTLGGIVAAVLYFGILNNSPIIQNIAVRKYNAGDLKGSLKLMETNVKLNPRNFRIRGTYAYLLLKLGNAKEADEQIDKAISGCVRQIDKYPLEVTKALVLWKQGDLDRAISVLEEIIQNYKTSNVYGALGFLYVEKGDLDKALAFNLEAYDYNSTNPIILDNLGYVRFLRKEYDEAMEIYVKLLKAKPTFPAAFYNYARVLQHFGKLDDAAYMCRYALSLRFWSLSAITREEIEKLLNELEEAIKIQQEEAEKNREAEIVEPREEACKANDEAAAQISEDAVLPSPGGEIADSDGVKSK